MLLETAVGELKVLVCRGRDGTKIRIRFTKGSEIQQPALGRRKEKLCSTTITVITTSTALSSIVAKYQAQCVQH